MLPGVFNEDDKNIALLEFFETYLEFSSTIYETRIEKINDVDLLESRFIENFKNTFLSNIPTVNDIRSLSEDEIVEIIKNAINLNKTKGTTLSIQYLFRALFANEVDVQFGRIGSAQVAKPLDYEVVETNSVGNPVITPNYDKFSNREFTKQIAEAGITAVMIGLNHHTYQGATVHQKQLEAINNCIAEGIFVYYVGYTLESLDHMEEVLEEIQSLGHKGWQYRIRAGSDIGRTPDEPKFYLSDHVKLIKQICDRKGWTWEKQPADDNLYHYMVNINGITHRIIQWSDPKTIDLEQLQCGPWCDFVPDRPVTNFLHQIMLRDAVINEKKNFI
jgi:hypothetical protein